MREIAIFTGILEVALLSGLVYSMAAFSQIFSKEGVFDRGRRQHPKKH